MKDPGGNVGGPGGSVGIPRPIPERRPGPAAFRYSHPRLRPCESVQRTPTTAGLFMLREKRQ